MASSISTDPQTWVFPPLGAPQPPSEVAAAFGPVHQGDTIELRWAPASSTPDVAMICTNDEIAYTISQGSSSPTYYTFDVSLGSTSSDSSSPFVCHFFFPDTDVGNTITFEYQNDFSSSSTVWTQNDQVGALVDPDDDDAADNGDSGGDSTTSGIVRTATVTFTLSPDGAAPTLTSTVSLPTTTFQTTFLGAATGAASNAGAVTSNGPGLSAGAAAGIAVGACAAVALLALALFCLFWRRGGRDGKRHGERRQDGNTIPIAGGGQPVVTSPPTAQGGAGGESVSGVREAPAAAAQEKVATQAGPQMQVANQKPDPSSFGYYSQR